MAEKIEQHGRLIRMDDFPSGDKMRDVDWGVLSKIISIFEKYGVNYLIATSPLLYAGVSDEEKLNSQHIHFLKKNVLTGRVVMHGFNHGFHHPWEDIVQTWEYGGEFKNMTIEEIGHKYDRCHKILSCLDTYDSSHFVPPFNAINQNLLDILKSRNVKFIHLNSHYYETYRQDRINFYDIEIMMAENARTYAHSPVILNNIYSSPGVITMHWVYDQDYKCIEEISKIAGRGT